MNSVAIILSVIVSEADTLIEAMNAMRSSESGAEAMRHFESAEKCANRISEMSKQAYLYCASDTNLD